MQPDWQLTRTGKKNGGSCVLACDTRIRCRQATKYTCANETNACHASLSHCGKNRKRKLPDKPNGSQRGSVANAVVALIKPVLIRGINQWDTAMQIDSMVACLPIHPFWFGLLVDMVECDRPSPMATRWPACVPNMFVQYMYMRGQCIL